MNPNQTMWVTGGKHTHTYAYKAHRNSSIVKTGKQIRICEAECEEGRVFG